MTRAVLALNAGSSSIKFALAAADEGAELRTFARGEVERIGAAPHLIVRDGQGRALDERQWPPGGTADYDALIGDLLGRIEGYAGASRLIGVGHRIVHGGGAFSAPVQIDAAALEQLEALAPLAPLHQQHSLAPVRAIMRMRPKLAQVASFDTAFHRTQPPVATRLALPRAYAEQGVRRYGFHGLSYKYIAGRLRTLAPALASGRVIVAHLGSGASLCAMQNGHSVDTTMGFSTLDGLMMGARCGDLDPGVILYMQRHMGLTVEQVEHVLYEGSGLLGVSGISSDMRDLLASPDPHAKEAIELFVYRVARESAALSGSLGGLDGFVFTAGIGEHAPEIRAAICRRLDWLGVRVDQDANARGLERISTSDSAVEVLVLPTDEEAVILGEALEVIDDGAGPENALALCADAEP